MEFGAGTVVVQGDPQDGWTMVSWDGMPVPAASLPTELFVLRLVRRQPQHPDRPDTVDLLRVFGVAAVKVDSK